MLGWTMSKLADMLPRTPWPVCLLPAPLSPPPHTHTHILSVSVCLYICMCVCVCAFMVVGTLPLRASDHTAQPWDLSNTAGTSPPPRSLRHPASTPIPSSPPPSYLSSPSLLPRLGLEALIQGCREAKGNISIFICFEGSETLLPLPSAASHQHKKTLPCPFFGARASDAA